MVRVLAAYLDTVQGHYSAIGLYPTNELHDQETQIQGYIEQFQPLVNRVFPAEWAGVRNLCRN